MTTPRPSVSFSADGQDPDLAAIEVDWSALSDGWRERNYRTRRADETPEQHANLIRAQVAEGIIPEAALAFADRVAG